MIHINFNFYGPTMSKRTQSDTFYGTSYTVSCVICSSVRSKLELLPITKMKNDILYEVLSESPKVNYYYC